MSLDLLEAALDYARRGWPVFPLHSPRDGKCSCGRLNSDRLPDCSPAKHPRTSRGLYDASTDPDVIRQWWTRWPDANIGIPTGVAFDVVDVDGPEALSRMVELAKGRKMQSGPSVATGRGWHLLHLPTGIRNHVGVLEGVDFRGKGGYVVAPPSVHISGVRYEWARYSGPDGVIDGPDEPLTALPDWFLDFLRPKPARPVVLGAGSRSAYGRAALESECGRVLLAPVGERNDTLNRAAFAIGQLVAGGEIDMREAVETLVCAADRCGLGEAESMRTIESGILSGARQPRKATSA